MLSLLASVCRINLLGMCNGLLSATASLILIERAFFLFSPLSFVWGPFKSSASGAVNSLYLGICSLSHPQVPRNY